MTHFFTRTIPILLFTLRVLTGHSQGTCPAIIDWKYLKTVNIYSKPEGKLFKQVKNDSTNEDYLQLIILKQTESHFYVSIHKTITKDSTTGWIKKGDYIGAYKRHEKFPMDLILYANNKVSDADKIIIANWTPSLLTIAKYADKWVFVTLNQDGKKLMGWIQTDELCANSYSYCN